MDIKISCKGFDAQPGYDRYIDLELSEIDFGDEESSTYVNMLQQWFSADDVVKAYNASDIVGHFDSKDVLEEIDEGDIADYMHENIDSSNLTDFVSEEVLENYAKQYIRDRKIDSIV